MIRRPRPDRFRPRCTMMFMNAQKPGLIRDAYIYGVDSIILDLEDAVSENQKDSARFSLYHALTTIDYGDTEVIVRINGLDTPYWREDIRVSVAGGADGIRIAKCESAEDVRAVENCILEAEREFHVDEGRTLLMAALESPEGVRNAYPIACASTRMIGISIAAGDFRRGLQSSYQRDGTDLFVARSLVVQAAKAAGVQCFDSAFTDLNDMEAFCNEVRENLEMGFDGKSLINPAQIGPMREIYGLPEREISQPLPQAQPVEKWTPRTIPADALWGGRTPYREKYSLDGSYLKKAGPRTRRMEAARESKVVSSMAEAMRLCGARDGMTFSFHHHLRNGDAVANLAMRTAVEELGLSDIGIAATGLGEQHGAIADYVEQGKITRIQTSGVRGRIGELISAGRLDQPVIIRSHGGRQRAIEAGEAHIDIAVLAAPTSDCMGNCRGIGGKSSCGSLGYAMTDAKYADHVIVVTDFLVPFPNMPASIEGIDVDAVVVVDSIGDPKKIATAAARITRNERELMMARAAARVIAAAPWFRDGFTFQTGVGGPSLAVNLFLERYMDERGIQMGCAIGGICGPMVEMLKKGKIRNILDVQDFDLDSVTSIHQTPGHYEISASQYANPANKGAFVNQLDFVVLAALEIDVNFNVNVLTGSDGVLRGAPGGHPDTAAGSKCCIVVTPLIRGRMATVCEHVVTVTTPGDCVDILVTDYGIAVNPLRRDLIACLDKAGISHVAIEQLKEKAYSIVGRPDEIQFEDRIVAVLEARDGTILDVVRRIRG